MSPPDDTVFVSKGVGGVRLQCDLRDHVSRVVYYRGWMDYGLETWMRHWLRPGDLYADVGAHIGYLAALAAEAVKPRGRVVAFEPSPATLEKLQAAFATSTCSHVEVVGAAVAATSGHATLFTAAGHWDHQAYRNSLHAAPGLAPHATVPTVSLDQYFPSQRLRLLKIDVEGGEQAVLAGARALLGGRRCDAVVIELNPEALQRGGSSVAAIVGILGEAGYAPHRCRPDGTAEPWSPVRVDAEYADAVFLPAPLTRATGEPHSGWRPSSRAGIPSRAPQTAPGMTR